MESKPKLPSSSREMRNIAEKMRRDKLNNYVSELASIVPLVCGSTKRIDKTSVLRLAANYIRMNTILGDVEDQKSAGTPGPVHKALLNTLEEVIGGFLMVITSSGKVVFISETIEGFFGYTQVDLLGNSIYNVLHPEDHDILREQLDDKASDDARKSFFCRMTEKALSRNDPARYEIIHIIGTLKPLPASCPSAVTQSVSKCPTDSVESAFSDSEEEECHNMHSASRLGTHMLIGFVRVVKDRPITELSLVESTQDEYITRHAMDGKILYTDHRISFVTGLMPGEVIGTSAFQYMHSEDMVWSMVAHKLMFTNTQGQGLVSYRLKCKGGSLVTLRSQGYIEINKQTGQPETFVCINTVVNNTEAKNEIKNQRRKLLPMIVNEQSENHLTEVPSSMPPEMLTMLRQLLDPNSLHKMIAEVDPSINMPQNTDISGILNIENSLDSFRCDEAVHKNNCSQQSNISSINENKSRKRKTTEEICNLPAKIMNQKTRCIPPADVSPVNCSPQNMFHLPNISPDIVNPLLLPSSPLDQEKLGFSQCNTLQDSSNSHSGRNPLKLSTNNMHTVYNHNCKNFERNLLPPNESNNMHSECGHQDRRLCNLSSNSYRSMFSSPIQGSNMGINFTTGRYQQPSKIDTSTCEYFQQRIPAVDNNKLPSSMCNQGQSSPQYLGSINDPNQNKNLSVSGNPYATYPPTNCDSNRLQQLYSPSVPESDGKLQRPQPKQERQHLHPSSNFQQQGHLSQERIKHHWLTSHSESRPFSIDMNSEDFCYIPDSHSAATTENQGTGFIKDGLCPMTATYDNIFFHSYGVNSHPKLIGVESEQHY